MIIRAQGYGGDIALRVGFDAEGKVTGIIVGFAQRDSPIWVQRLPKRNSAASLRGFPEKLCWEKILTPITGATISSRGVAEAVNTARSYMEKYLLGGPVHGEQ